MGWLFGHYTRRDLVDHLCNGNGVKTLKRCFVGNNLWTVQETVGGIRFACLYKLQGNPRVTNDPCNWGYKAIDESMGPLETSFPLAWLDLLSPTESKYALEWREAVRARHDTLKAVLPGSVWLFGGREYTVISRRSPKSWNVVGGGIHYRMSASHFARAALIKEA